MDLKRKAIRVGIAVSLCMLVSNLLKLKFPFFVLLPAVMPIWTFFGETIKFIINRIIGGTIGAVIGVVFTIIKLQNILLLIN
ncbi:FUSC family protein [Clostridium sporogenes]|uniref:aromatic acid exporter family protein n=1 Tax=Clostridium sporogenes TaxID=1509 RepID=UPI001C107A6D|nr:aromatic acid exporter family protein [Clostridium sporogenes]MBU5300070.1 FUSC family protein [Clostridium sporogenes]